MLTPISLEDAENALAVSLRAPKEDEKRTLELEIEDSTHPSSNRKWNLSKLSVCGKIQWQKTFVIFTMLTMIVVTMNMTCYSHLKYIPRILKVSISDLPNNSPANIACKTLHAVFVRSTVDERRGLDDLLTFGFAMPLVLVSVLSAWNYSPKSTSSNSVDTHIQETRPTEFSFTKLTGDPPLTFLSLFFVVFPSLYITFEIYLYEKLPSLGEAINRIANPAGIAACFALSLFLIPVAKHSPLIKVFGLSFTQALFFHRISGWISLILSLIHGVFYFYMYGSRGKNFADFWVTMIKALYPPRTCWGWDIFDLQGQIHHESCFGYWRNFSGTIALVAFVVLGITSLEPVRRRIYSIFIYVHIPAAWFMMIGAIIHFRFIALFLMPNIVYYLVTSGPEWVKHFIHARSDKGPNVKSITWIADSSECFQIELRCPPSKLLNKNVDLTHGAFCKICVPEISSIWHPFSVIIAGHEDKAALLIRATGPFTKDLCNRLFPDDFRVSASESSILSQVVPQGEKLRVRTLRPPPRVLVDGFYPAEYRWHERVLFHHDSVLLLAGGVGIVPFLTLLPCVMKELNEYVGSGKLRLRHLTLHWYCREEGLAKFVCDHYNLRDLFDSTRFVSDQSIQEEMGETIESQSHEENQIALQCFIHITSQRSPDNDFRIESDGLDCDDSGNEFIVDVTTGKVDENQTFKLDLENPRNTTIEFKNQVKGRVWTDALSSQKNILFTSSIILSIIVHWYYHSLSLFQDVMARTYPVLVILAIGVILGIIQLISERWSCKYIRNTISSRKFQFLPNLDDYSETDNIENNGSHLNSSPHVQDINPHSCVENHLTKSFSVGSGRPPIEEVTGPLINAQIPGAFFCGPKILRDRVKGEITKKRRDRHGRFSKVLPCAFYDEHSDI